MSILFNLNFKDKNIKLIYLLKNIYGLSIFKSKIICNDLGVDVNIKINDLNENDINKINSIINSKRNYIIDNDLKKNIYDNILLLKNLKTYKGLRHEYKLPVNGQNTHNNAKTQRWIQKKK